MSSALQLVDAADAATALLHPLRGRLLEQFQAPRSTAEVARKLGLPRQRVGHHVRVLRERGLLEAAGERRTSNFVEQLLQATARAYVIAPQALGDLAGDPAEVRDRFSSEYLAATAARTIRDLVALRRQAEPDGKKIATVTLETEIRFSGPGAQAAFAQELAGALAGLVGKYHDDESTGGRRFRFTIGGYPVQTEENETADHEGNDDQATRNS